MRYVLIEVLYMNNKTKLLLLNILYVIKKPFPCLYYSEYIVMKNQEIEEHKEVQIFKMCFGKVLWVKRWIVI